MKWTLTAAHELLTGRRAELTPRNRGQQMEKTYRHPSPEEIKQHMANASTELLRRAREFINGCGRSSDETCECDECVAATALLDEIDKHMKNC